MASLSAFDINIVQPNESLIYELSADFWKLFEDSLVEKGKLTATVGINKSAGSFQLLFNIQGM